MKKQITRTKISTKKIVLFSALATLLLVESMQAQCVSPYGQDPTQFTLTFQDEFNGTTLDASKWNDHVWYDNSSPPGNYTVEGGALKMWPATPFNKLNRTIDTDGKYYQTYGYYEIEAKLPYGKGTWPAFWLYNHDAATARPEIDIMEAYGGGGPSSGWGDANLHPIIYAATTHYPETASIKGPSPSMDLSAGFHKYACKWESNKVTYFFDGKSIGVANVTMPNRMYIMLDLWLGSASGTPDGTTPTGKTNSYIVNYCRAWKLGGPGCSAPPATPNATFCTAAQGPVIDGIAESTWTNITSNTITKAVTGTPSSATDLSADYKATWDNTALYLLVNVKDDILKNDSGTNTWDDDAIEVFVDGNNDKATSYDANDHQYIFRVNDPNIYSYKTGIAQTSNPTGVTFSQGALSGGYLMEIKILWSALGVTAVNAKLVGLDLHLDDDDNGGTADKILSWFSQAGQSPATDPSTFGIIKLDNISCGGVSTGINNEEKSNSISVYPNPFTANFTLKISSEIIIKDAVIKIYDVCGKEVKTISINSNEMIIDRDELQNGIYFYSVINNPDGYRDESITKGKLVIQ